MGAVNQFSFCESLQATSVSPWHIRRLTAAGPKYRGGADTESLCGRKMGWDLETAITPLQLQGHTCVACLKAYREAVPA